MERSALLGQAKKLAAVLLSLALALVCLAPPTAFAQDSSESASPNEPSSSSEAASPNDPASPNEPATPSKVVRVGWYESPFNSTDQFGRRSGYAYEYQRKIAAYTGWTYEYVEGSWPELMQKLRNGEIDLLSDVSYTNERTEAMLFDALPMGEEVYYLFCTSEDTGIDSQDFSSLNGKKVGVDLGSIQKRPVPRMGAGTWGSSATR